MVIFFLYVLSFNFIIFNKVNYYLKNFFSILFIIDNYVFSFLKRQFEYLRSYKFLVLENRNLRKDIFFLKLQLINFNNLKLENKNFRNFFFLFFNQDKEYIFAEVLFSLNFFVDEIIINKGKLDNIYENDLLVNDLGFVGKIILVDNYISKVQLLCNRNSILPVKSLRSNFNLNVVGDGCANRLKSYYIPYNADIKVGDVLVVSNLVNNINLKDFPVGVITNILWDKKCFCFNIVIKSFVDFKKLNYVLVYKVFNLVNKKK